MLMEKNIILECINILEKNGGWENWSTFEIEQFEYERKPELRARVISMETSLRLATLNSNMPNRDRC
jgi:hypothetical protein